MKKVDVMNAFELSRLKIKDELKKSLQDYKLAKKKLMSGETNS
jgi:hypothetical protein